MLKKSTRLEILEKASLCRHFENKVFKLIKKGKVKFPVYFSAGQEYVACTLGSIFKDRKIKPMLFGQHRGHSIYIGFGGDLKKLLYEFLGSSKGSTYGMGGSLSIHSDKINMYGHDGFMGSNVCLAVGASFASKKPSIVFIGDAAFEEDYVLASISWIAKKNIPTLIVVEDNNFAITTSKDERRDWTVKSIAKAFNIDSFDTKDDPEKIFKVLKSYKFKKPLIVNIHTNRLYWHTGAGVDDENVFDRLKDEKNKLDKDGEKVFNKTYIQVEKLFKDIINEK